jgi:DNA replication protein DnaC
MYLVGLPNSLVSGANNDSDFDYSIESYDSDDLNSGDSYLCNAMVLYGPHGIGKTAMVYAMASELGFKVFFL